MARIVAELGTIQVRRMRGVRVDVRALKIREALVRLGPAFVKIGQALSTRRDALPRELCDELTRLQDDMAASLSSAEAVGVIESELGREVTELFVGLDSTSKPVAAASLGQVYKAWDVKSGATVAVKVQRADVAEVVALDASSLRLLAKMLAWLVGARSDLASIVDEVVGKIADELDYEREARDAERFRRLYGHLARAPSVVWHLTSRRVLTLGWVEGVKLERWAAPSDEARQSLIERGVACTVTQFFEAGFFHSDPHPGNLLVTGEGSLCYLDFGKMGELCADDRVALMTLLVHFVNRDAEGLAQDFVNLGCIGSRGEEVAPFSAPPASLVAALDATLQRRRTGRLSFQGVFDEVNNALPGGRRSPLSFRLPARFAGIVRALGALEGAVLAVDPDFRVVSAAYPHVARALLRDKTVDGRRALLQLVIDRDSGAIHWTRLRALAAATNNATLLDAVHALGPAYAAAFVQDAIGFLDSPAGARTRAALVADAKAAIDGDALCNLDGEEAALRVHQVHLVLLDRPDVWLPVLARAARSAELLRSCALVLDYFLASVAARLPAAGLVLASAWLFRGTTKNNKS